MRARQPRSARSPSAARPGAVRRRGSLAVRLLTGLLVLSLPAHAESDPSAEPATSADAAAAAPASDARGEDVTSPQSKLSGEEIYQCVLDNRFDAYTQHARLLSGDRGDAEQESRLRMTWQSFRAEDNGPTKGVLSKTVVRYLDPFDLRFSGYLIINNFERDDDQWVYLPTYRRIRRVNLRREAVFGTDFTFEDIVPREMEDGSYRRLPDELQEGTPVYVVEVSPKAHSNSEYSKFVLRVDKRNCVPLLTKYWDDKDVLVKELQAPAEHVTEMAGVHFPMQLTMTNVQLETYTTLVVEELEPNPDLGRKTFDLRRLEAH